MCAIVLFVGVSFKYEKTVDMFLKENELLQLELENKELELLQRDKGISSQEDNIINLNNIIVSERKANSHMRYLGKFKLSFYSKEMFPENTATGVKGQAGITIAADPSIIPLNKSVYIEGFGVRFVQDTGGAIKGNKIDVFVNTTKEAKQLGVKKNVDVWVIE